MKRFTECLGPEDNYLKEQYCKTELLNQGVHIDRLTAYEDTGYTPEQLTKILAEYTELKQAKEDGWCISKDGTILCPDCRKPRRKSHD